MRGKGGAAGDGWEKCGGGRLTGAGLYIQKRQDRRTWYGHDHVFLFFFKFTVLH